VKIIIIGSELLESKIDLGVRWHDTNIFQKSGNNIT